MNFQGSNVNPMGNCAMPASGTSCGCGCPTVAPTYQQCNQVVHTCNVQDVPHYTNYNTHIVNNCVKRHVNIPTYSTTSENVMVEEYVQGQPMYQGQQVPYNQGQFMNPGMYPNTGYLGNLPEGMTPNGYNPNMMPGGFYPFGM